MMKKFFMLSAAVLLSIAASAQVEDAITHRYPEVKFKIGTQEYTVPAWDVWCNKPNIKGNLRVARKAQKSDGSYTGKYVTCYALYDDAEETNRLYVPKIAANPDVTVSVNGEDKTFKLKDLTYKDVFGESADVNFNIKVIGDGASKLSGNYTVQTDFTTTAGEHYLVDEIGDYVFRQPDRTENSANWFTPETITIPKEITTIGRGAFFMVRMKKVVFEEGSTVTDIKEFNFQDCLLLEEITFPSSVTNLTGTVLGGCPSLKRINFLGENAPALTPFTWVGKTYNVFVSSTSAGATQLKNCVVSVPLGSYNDESEWYTMFSNSLFSSPITLKKDMTTFCSEVPFTVKQWNSGAWADGELKAFYVKSEDIHEKSIGLTEITTNNTIPGVFGVIMSGTAGETYDLFYPRGTFTLGGELNVENCLVGAVEATPIEIQEDYLYFVLSDGKFHPVTKNGTIAAHKAYLMVSQDINMDLTSNVKSVYIAGTETSGIKATEAQNTQDNVWYTLQGTRVSQPTKGLFIMNGKKVIVK